VRDRRPLPEGVVSKQSQAYLIVGLSVMILLAVMFSNNRAKPAAKPSAASPAVVSTDANQRSIEELKRDLAEEQRKSAEQAQSQKSAGSVPSSSAAGGAQTGTTPGNNMPAHVEPPRDPVKDAERALNFKARFASNLVSVTETAAHPAATQSDQAATSLPGQTGRAAQASAATSKHAPEVNINSAFGQPYVLFEGTTVSAGANIDHIAP
jgi:type IV secretion system protein VirB10